MNDTYQNQNQNQGQQNHNQQNREYTQGLIERITYHNTENGFCVLRVKIKGFKDLVTVTGYASMISAGEYISASGSWFNDKQHGRQFKASFLKASTPTTTEGIEKYLGSGMIRGIGSVYAKKLVKAFGNDVFDVIEQSPEKLIDIEGIGKHRSQKIIEGWNDQKAIREIMLFLHSHKVNTARAVRIYKIYGAEAVSVINENPYRLAQDIRGIGFLTADNIAKSIGIEEHSIIRAKAGMRHVLLEGLDQGHVGLPLDKLIEECVKILDIPSTIIIQAIDESEKEKETTIENVTSNYFDEGEGHEIIGSAITKCVFLTNIYNIEKSIAKDLKIRMARTSKAEKGKVKYEEGRDRDPTNIVNAINKENYLNQNRINLANNRNSIVENKSSNIDIEFELYKQTNKFYQNIEKHKLKTENKTSKSNINNKNIVRNEIIEQSDPYIENSTENNVKGLYPVEDETNVSGYIGRRKLQRELEERERLSKQEDNNSNNIDITKLNEEEEKSTNVDVEQIENIDGISIENEDEVENIYKTENIDNTENIDDRAKSESKKFTPWGIHRESIDKYIAGAESELSIKLADSQKEAVKLALENKIAIITGGPGVGKTTIVNSILTILAKRKLKILLAAPTGRAAKRLSESTKREAVTIHRLLEVDFASGGGFKRGIDYKLDCDVLVVDEASMIDIMLMSALMRALPNKAGLLIVGDIDQLPSVGPGQVLRDMIESKLIPTARLTEVFRQAATSNIIINAHKINKGIMPNLEFNANSDFHFIEAKDPADATAKVIELMSNRIPKKYNVDPVYDIQVLTPSNKGGIGAQSLNIELQKVFASNSFGEEKSSKYNKFSKFNNANNSNNTKIERFGYSYSIGNKVMQTQNDYDREVYNGDIGYITDINVDATILTIEFDQKKHEYDFGELDRIIPAYAVTIHKSQGSEYPVVIIPIMMTNYMMLRKNLIYTAITRGKRLVVIVGEKNAIALAIKSANKSVRWCKLKEWLIT